MSLLYLFDGLCVNSDTFIIMGVWECLIIMVIIDVSRGFALKLCDLCRKWRCQTKNSTKTRGRKRHIRPEVIDFIDVYLLDVANDTLGCVAFRKSITTITQPLVRSPLFSP